MSKRETSASLRAESTDATVLPKSKSSCESATWPRNVSSKPRVDWTGTVAPVGEVLRIVDEDHVAESVAPSWGAWAKA
jgi:hypothetical protein